MILVNLFSLCDKCIGFCFVLYYLKRAAISLLTTCIRLYVTFLSKGVVFFFLVPKMYDSDSNSTVD
jgi:hypothetical protein